MKRSNRIAAILWFGALASFAAYAIPQAMVQANVERSHYAIDPQTLELAQDPPGIGGVTPR